MNRSIQILMYFLLGGFAVYALYQFLKATVLTPLAKNANSINPATGLTWGETWAAEHARKIYETENRAANEGRQLTKQESELIAKLKKEMLGWGFRFTRNNPNHYEQRGRATGGSGTCPDGFSPRVSGGVTQCVKLA